MAKSSLIGGSFPELEALNKKKGTILADIDLLISDLKKVMAVYESVHSKLYAGAMDRVLSRKVSGYNFFKAFLSNAEDLKKRITKIDAIEKKGLKRAYHFLWESFFNIKRLWQKDLDVPVMADNADILKKELAASDDFDAISILKNHFSAILFL